MATHNASTGSSHETHSDPASSSSHDSTPASDAGPSDNSGYDSSQSSMSANVSQDRIDSGGGSDSYQAPTIVKSVTDLLGESVSALTSSVADLRTWVSSQISAAVSGVQALISSAQATAQSAYDSVLALGTEVYNIIAEKIQAAKDAWQWVIDESTAFFSGGLQALKDWITGLYDKAVNAADAVKVWTQTQLSKAITALTGVIKGIQDELTAFKELINNPEELWTILEKTIIGVW